MTKLKPLKLALQLKHARAALICDIMTRHFVCLFYTSATSHFTSPLGPLQCLRTFQIFHSPPVYQMPPDSPSSPSHLSPAHLSFIPEEPHCLYTCSLTGFLPDTECMPYVPDLTPCMYIFTCTCCVLLIVLHAAYVYLFRCKTVHKTRREDFTTLERYQGNNHLLFRLDNL